MELVYRDEIMPRDIEDDIRFDATARYPEESIGVIAQGKYVALKNVAEDPKHFAIPEPEKYRNMLADGIIDAVVHSHPDAPFCPSGADMQSQINTDVPFGVLGVYGGACSRVALWGDTLVRPDMYDRPFQHGITDCYEAIRDWYFVEKNILMKQFVRDWEWWIGSENQRLYIEGFGEAGFEVVPTSEGQPGDVILFRIRSQTHNHASVYLGNNLMYHHSTHFEPYAPKHLAKKEPIARWMNYDPIFVRPIEGHEAIERV